MSLTCVKMSEDVWLTCLTHALSTETEEIMGLLLGDIEYKNGNVIALIWGASPQTRSDRRKDRVETNPEQLAAASAQAEISLLLSFNTSYYYYNGHFLSILLLFHRMTTSTGRTTRVIGWYHSHPHITVLPSHVDVRTQGMYQLLDSGFIGLIFSCFSEDSFKVGRIQVIAFQSSDGKQSQISRPISLSPVNRNSVIDLESSSSSAEIAPVRSGAVIETSEQDISDSRMAGGNKVGGRSSDLGVLFANADASSVKKDRFGGSYNTNHSNDFVDIDPMDMSESMQEAMHRSNLDISGAEYVRKEVPLYVMPTSSLIKLDSPLTSFTDLQRVLYEEEQAAYNQAILQNMRDWKVHPLAFVHHTSTYQASMCKLIEYCLSPAISALQDRLRENETRVEYQIQGISSIGCSMLILKDEAKNLEAETVRMSNLSSGSPRQVPSHGPRGSVSPSSSMSGAGSRSKRGWGLVSQVLFLDIILAQVTGDRYLNHTWVANMLGDVDWRTVILDHANTSTFRGENHANDVVIPGLETEETLELSEEEEDPLIPSLSLLPALMFVPATGTAPPPTAELITSPAALAASSAVLSRMTSSEAVAAAVTTALTCLVLAALVLALAAAVVVVADPAGNLVTGFATGLDAMSTTLQAELSVLDAMLLGTHTRHYLIFKYSFWALEPSDLQRENERERDDMVEEILGVFFT
ncbi:hypothetical protein G4B88_022842 [Cannabis sativa]|uniref:MPN domain-containing protein n=1 Tax=Cannabis sativa TaxID=3483 RepID=A0A7J6HY30_CANSA|nr:hypothetical protein G4B88_022842 [Cannabis sativa]